MAKKKKTPQGNTVSPASSSISDTEASLNTLFKVLTIVRNQPSKKAKSKRNNPKDLVDDWNDYFQKGTLSDFQRLCGDLGLDDDLPSKTQCRLALKKVYVNIPQFLECDNKPEDVILFKSHGALVRYTLNNRKIFPNRGIPKGSPLRDLLRIITG